MIVSKVMAEEEARERKNAKRRKSEESPVSQSVQIPSMLMNPWVYGAYGGYPPP